MGTCKKKGHSGRFRHIHAYSSILRNYSGIFRTLCKPGIFRTLLHSEIEVYSEPWHIRNQKHIQNSDIFKTLAYSEAETYSEPEAYSEPCETSKLKRFAKIVNSYNYFHNVSFSRCPLYEINMNFFHTGLIFTPEVYILCKKVWAPRGAGEENFDIPFIIESLCTDKCL